MRKNGLIVCITIAALALLPGNALAHPHIVVDAKTSIVLDGSGNLIAIRHAWTFDEAFSVWQISGLDANGDGVTPRRKCRTLPMRT